MSDCLCSLCTVRRDGTYKIHCQKCGPGAFLPTPTSIASKSKAHKHCRERGSHNGIVRLSTTLKLTDCRTDYFLVCNWWFTAFVGRSSHQRYMYMYILHVHVHLTCTCTCTSQRTSVWLKTRWSYHLPIRLIVLTCVCASKSAQTTLCTDEVISSVCPLSGVCCPSANKSLDSTT